MDGGTATIFNTTIQKTVRYQHLLFKSNELNPTSHTLVITTLSDDTYFLDYIEVTPPVTATPSLTLFGASTLATVPLGTTSPVVSSKAGLPLGPIIGGALGGLAILIFAFVLVHRRSNNRSHYGELTNSSCKFHVPLVRMGVVIELNLLQVWTIANADLVPAHTALSGKRSLMNVSTPSPNTSQVNAAHQGFHAHGASASSPSNGATISASTSDQVSASIAFPPDLSPPPYQA